MESLSLKIKGMSCASCANSIEKELKKIDGLEKNSVSFATELGYFEFSKPNIEKKIKLTLKELGYTYEESGDSKPKTDEDFKKDLKKGLNLFYFSMTLSLLLFSLAMWPLKDWPSQQTNWLLQLILATPIWIYIGWKFQKAAFLFLKTGRSNMNTLIGIGTSAAFLYSLFVTLFTETSVNIGLTQRVYFEAVGFIISFVYLGHYFEGKAKRKTREALNSLFKLSSKKASLITNGEEKTIPVEKVVPGDIVRVRPGEKFPVDGIIQKGESSLDESMITGESEFVLKSRGDKVFTGTINGESVIDYQVTKVGSETFLAQIIAFVEKAQNSKPKIQKYADKISGIFTPIIIVISVITFLTWFFLGPEPAWGHSISNFIAVLVIACPCALGLATPTAIIVATGKASTKGLLIKGGDVIENAIGISTIVFDKTGTLTEGRPSIASYLFSPESMDKDGLELLKDVASIEEYSEHPLSKAIVSFALEKSLSLEEPDSFEIVKGKGIISEIHNKAYVIGNQKILDDHNIKLNEEVKPEDLGTYVYVAVNQEHIGTFIIRDEIKKGAREVIQSFKKAGLETWMITGDNERIASFVAHELGIDHYIANALPLEKSTYIENIQKKGIKVAMVGDGVNDAPALAKSDLSLAMGTGTDVAINTSDVTIVKGDLVKALEFIKLANGTMSIIKQNLFLSMIYNILLIPIAAGVLFIFGGPMMPPVFAGVAMALSSISVVLNSLRIRHLI